MAGEDRTEQATPRKRQDAREKGQVAKSMEVNAALGLLAGFLAIKWFGPGLVTTWQDNTLHHLMQIGRYHELTTSTLQMVFMNSGITYLKLVMPMLLFLMAVGVLSNVLQTGFIFSTHTLNFDFGRLNPLQGITRMFSMRSTMDLCKAAAKSAVIGYIIYSFFRDRGPEMTRLGWLEYSKIGPAISGLSVDLLLKASLIILVIAGIDYMFQRYQFEKQLRMTKQEIKEEYKRTEGDPLIKSRARQRAREMAQRRMMADVPKATVVITNPTHLAIALRYVPGEMLAPLIVAKGKNLIAQKIKEIAREHGVPVIENKPLARAMFEACEIGDSIPVELYEAVAEIIAFVFKQSGRSPIAPSAKPARA